MKHRRLLCAALSMALLSGLFAAPAMAAEYEAETVMVEMDPIIPEDLGVTDEELFAGYAEKTLYGNDYGVSAYGLSGGQRLGVNTPAYKLYEYLKGRIAAVAAGSLSSTEFTLSRTQLQNMGFTTSWTWAELGISPSDAYISSINSATLTTAGKAAIQAKYLEEIQFYNLLNALLHDCPYELYWFDKTTGFQPGYALSIEDANANDSSTLDSGCVTQALFRFYVSPDYSSNGAASTIEVDTTLTGATTRASTNAKNIVAANAGKNIFERLTAYKDTICGLVSYNDDAAEDDYSGGYGDPWQLIHVFDHTSGETGQVVCEGYSKAFQYLCDLDGGIACYTVTGSLEGGGHMWNTVTLGGKNYMVDVTNSDSGMIGEDGGIFLSGADGRNQTYNGEVYDYMFEADGTNVYYDYDDDTLSMLGSNGAIAGSVLEMAMEEYVYDPAHNTVPGGSGDSGGSGDLSDPDLIIDGTFEGYVNTDVFEVVLPTSAALDFIMDPQQLISNTNGASLAADALYVSDNGSTFTRNATMFFRNLVAADGENNIAEHSNYTDSSDLLNIVNKGTMPVDISLNASLTGLSMGTGGAAVTASLSGDRSFADDTSTSIYMALTDGSNTAPITPAEGGNGAVLTSSLGFAEGAYKIAYDALQEKYVYIIEDESTVTFPSYGFRLTGAANPNGDWKGFEGFAPTVTITWTVTPAV